MGGDLTDLKVWKAAAAMGVEAIRASAALRASGALPLADQVVRAAASVPANIAEGYGRGFGRDGARFLRIARGSAVELESHVRVAWSAGLIGGAEAAALVTKARAVRAMLRGLLKHLNENAR